MEHEDTLPLAFISYSRKEAEFAKRLYADLSAAGIKVWMDTREIRPGTVDNSTWDSAIQDAIKNCEYFIPIITSASMSSENVLDECNYAVNLSKPIVPVLQEDYELYYRLQRLQWIDCTDNYESGLQELISTLHGNPTTEMQVLNATQYLTDSEFHTLLFKNRLVLYGGLLAAIVLTVALATVFGGLMSIILSLLLAIVLSIVQYGLMEKTSLEAGRKLTTQQLARLRDFRRFLIPQRLLD